MARAKLAGHGAAREGATLTLHGGADATPADGWERIDRHITQASDPSEGRVARMRQQVDALLARMLDDDGESGPEEDISPVSGQATDFPGLDDSFWGPDEDAAPAPASGYRSKHRLAGPAKERRPKDVHHGKPRHAAPPASFVVALSHWLAVIKLTGHYAARAAHAA
jgi:hypothetical protein